MKMEELLAKIKRPFPKFGIVPGKSALLLIDMQKLAGVDWIVEEAVKKGIAKDIAREVVAKMDKRIKKVLDNSKRILEACRKKGIEVIHVKIEAKTRNGRDVGRLHRLHNFIIPLGSTWAEFFEEVKPKKKEGNLMTKTEEDPTVSRPQTCR